jgi:anthranilate 1,2-dioxygenase small subunit
MSLDALAAERAILDLIGAYAHAIDDDRLEEWPDFFTADGRYTIMPCDSHAKGYPVGIMNCESPGMMKDRVLAYRQANVYEPHWYRHLLSATRIVSVDSGIYRVETAYAVIRTMQDGTMSVFSAGKYVDRIVFEGAVPRFRERLVLTDSNRVDTLIVIPI